MKKGFLEGYGTYDTSNGYGNPQKWKEALHERMGKPEAEALLNKQNDSPHAILGVSVNATKAEIVKAFRRLIKEWHPDRNQYRAEVAEVKSKLLIAAYTSLTS